MGLLTQLGLKPLGAPAVTQPIVRSLGGPGGKPKGELTLGGATLEKLSLGPPVEGPRIKELWALLSQDGSGPLNSSNSNTGARLNELGRALLQAFQQLHGTQKAWYARLGAVDALAKQGKVDLEKLAKAAAAIGKRTGRRSGAYVRSHSEAYVKALRKVENGIREIGPKVSSMNAAVERLRAAGLNRDVDQAKRGIDDLKGKIEDEKARLEKLKERLGGLLGIAINVVKQDWAAVAEDAAKFVGEQLIDQIPNASLKALEKDLEDATANLHGLEDRARAAELKAAADDLEAATGVLRDAHADLRDAVADLGLAQKSAIEALGESPDTAIAAKMIANRSKMLKLLQQANTAVARYQGEAKPVLVELERVKVLYAGFPGLMKRMPDIDVNGAYAQSLAAAANENAEALDVWASYVRDTQNSALTALRMLSDSGADGYMGSYNRIEAVLQAAIADR